MRAIRFSGGNRPRSFTAPTAHAFGGGPIAERGNVQHAVHGNRVRGGVAGYAPEITGNFIILETSGYILLEDGGKIMLEVQ